MRTYILIFLVAAFSVAQSKSLSRGDILRKLLDDLKHKRPILMSNYVKRTSPPVSEEPEVVCLGKDNHYYRVGEQFGMFDNDCYYCKFDSSCDIYCDEDDYCRDEQIKKCSYKGVYYPMRQAVYVPGANPFGADSIFDENCQIYPL